MKREELQRRMAAAYGATEVSTSGDPEQLATTEAFQKLARLAKGNRRERRAVKRAVERFDRKRA